jgi:hypothetical protein
MGNHAIIDHLTRQYYPPQSEYAIVILKLSQAPGKLDAQFIHYNHSQRTSTSPRFQIQNKSFHYEISHHRIQTILRRARFKKPLSCSTIKTEYIYMHRAHVRDKTQPSVLVARLGATTVGTGSGRTILAWLVRLVAARWLGFRTIATWLVRVRLVTSRGLGTAAVGIGGTGTVLAWLV